MLESAGVIGVSWRGLPADALANFALAETELPDKLRAFARSNALSELVYLGTCNRIELLYVCEDATQLADLRSQGFELLTGRKPAPGEAERTIRCWLGEGAAEHLFMVASGLDSACLGENEIVAQLRRALERSAEIGLLGTELRAIGELALQISARVRSQTQIGRGRTSLGEIAVEQLLESLPVLGSAEVAPRIVLIGISPMIARVAQSLRDRGIPYVVVNRTVAKAELFAKEHNASFMSLESFLNNPPAVGAIVTAVGAEEPIVSTICLKKIQSRLKVGEVLSVIDFGVPPNIDPAICEQLNIRRVGMTDIAEWAERSRSDRGSQAAAARLLIDAALDELRESISERLYKPLLGALQNRYQLTAREGLNRLFKKDLSGLGEQERLEIERWCFTLAKRFAHIPSLGLRGLIRKGPPGSIDAFIEALDAPFSEELRTALSKTINNSGNH